jgi:hypothetical protein
MFVQNNLKCNSVVWVDSFVQILSGTKCFSVSCEYNATNAVICGTLIERIDYSKGHFAVKAIENIRAVECYGGDTIFCFEIFDLLL